MSDVSFVWHSTASPICLSQTTLMSDFRRARQGSSDVFFVHKFTHLFCYTGDRRNGVEKMLISNPLEVWLITFSSRLRKILIYHESCKRFCTVVQGEELIRGFHLQPWEFHSIADTLFRIHRHLQNYTTGSGVPVYKKNAAQRLLKEGPQKNDRYRKKNRKNHQKKLVKQAGLHQETKHVLYLLQQLKRGEERSPQE